MLVVDQWVNAVGGADVFTIALCRVLVHVVCTGPALALPVFSLEAGTFPLVFRRTLSNGAAFPATSRSTLCGGLETPQSYTPGRNSGP